jgi:hypothetical protein
VTEPKRIPVRYPETKIVVYADPDRLQYLGGGYAIDTQTMNICKISELHDTDYDAEFEWNIDD